MEGDIDATSPPAKRHLDSPDENLAETACESNPQNIPKQKLSAQKEANARRKEQNGFKPSSYKRSAKSLIHLAFNREYSIFEVTKKSKNYLHIMGVPLKNGGHVLFPEEVVYLMELWSAFATDAGRPLTLYDGIRILGQTGFPFYKYRAYSALRKAGFVVLRPDRSRVLHLPLQEQCDRSTEPSTSSSRSSKECGTIFECSFSRYPKHLLDDFPTIKDSKFLISSMLHRNCQLIPIGDLRGFPYNPLSYRIPYKPMRNSRKLLRPAYWPDFENITTTVSSWREYARERRSSIKSAEKAAYIRRQARAQEMRSEYDFEVFLSDRFAHSLPAPPAFRVICFDSRQGALSCAYAHRFAGDIPLMLSIFDCGYITFIETSGRAIDLNRYLESLTKESQ